MNINDITTWILDTVSGVDPMLRTLIAGVAIALETSVLLGLVVPGDTVVLVAATGIKNWPEWGWLIAACMLGALLGETVGYTIGRLIGPWIERKLAHRWPKASVQWQRAENYLRRRGGPAIFLSRFLPVAHSLVPLIVGSSGVAYKKFVAWTLPACLIWALAYASAGWAASGTYRELSSQLHGAGYVFVGVIVTFLVVVALVKRWLYRRERRHMLGDDA